MCNKFYLSRVICILSLAAILASFTTGCSKQAKASRHLSKGEKAFAGGKYDNAEIEFLNVIKNDPENRAAFARLVSIYFDQGRATRAYPFLFRSLQLDTNNPDLRLRAGFVLMASGKTLDARSNALFVLSQHPKDSEAPILLAEASTTPQEISDTRQRLQKLILAGDSAPFQLAMGILSLREHETNTAETAFRRALSLDPKLAAAHAAMAGIYQAQNNLKQTDLELKNAADLSPLRSARRIEYARFKAKTGEIATAHSMLDDLTKQAPDFIPAWLLLARFYFDEHNLEKCSDSLARVLARDPTHYDGLQLNSRVYLAKGDTAKARTEIERLIKCYPQAARPWYEMALINLAADDPVKASGNLDQALSIDPGLSEAVILRADLGIRRGEIGPAITSLQKYIKQNPQTPQPWFLLASAYRIQGKPEEAISLYKQLQNAFPSNAQPAFLSGLIYREMRKPDEARQAFIKVLKIAPDSMAALEQLVEMDVIDKQFSTALERVQLPLQKFPKQPEPLILQASVLLAQRTQAATNQAITCLRKAIELQTDYRPAYFLLAQIYVASGESKHAMDELKEIISHNPKDHGALMLLGMISEQNREFENARDYYEKALAVRPKFAAAANNLACLYSENFNQLDKAYAMARIARDNSRNDPSIADTLGWILFKRAEYSDALTMLQESAAQVPDNPDIQTHLGMVLYMMGFEDSARNTFQHALQINRDFSGKTECSNCLSILSLGPKDFSPSARALLEKRLTDNPNDLFALVRMATFYEREGSFDKAISAYQKVIQNNPNNIKALTGLALLTANHLKQPEKALELAKKANKTAPNDPAVSHLLGKLAIQSGDCRWAASLLREAIRKQPDNPEISYDLAEAFFGLGQIINAQTTLQTITQIPFARQDQARRLLDLLALAATPSQALAAQSSVDQILQKSPNYPPALLVSGLIAEQRNEPEAALSAYQKVLTQFPDQSQANKRFAVLSAEQTGTDRKPFEAATKAREAMPSDPEVAKALGIIVYKQNDYNRAVTLLKESAVQLSTDPLVAYYLGLAQYQLKQRADSKKSMQRALDLHLPARLVPETKRILAEK